MVLLDPVLPTFRIRAAALRGARLAAPWSLRLATGERPSFILVAAGTCRLEPRTGGALELHGGDSVVFPEGGEHALRDGGIRRCDEAWLLHPWQRGWLGQLERPDDAPECCLVAGSFEFRGSAAGPALGLLPPLVHVSGRHGSNIPAWLDRSLRGPGPRIDGTDEAARAALDRLVELAVLDILASFSAAHDDGRLPRDRRIARALARIHDESAGGATLEELATEAGMSRAAFCERFRQLVGEPPGRYVMRSRMLRAAEWLTVDGLTPQEVAARLGYATTSAFSRAFKRALGSTPSRWVLEACAGAER